MDSCGAAEAPYAHHSRVTAAGINLLFFRLPQDQISVRLEQRDRICFLLPLTDRKTIRDET